MFCVAVAKCLRSRCEMFAFSFRNVCVFVAKCLRDSFLVQNFRMGSRWTPRARRRYYRGSCKNDEFIECI